MAALLGLLNPYAFRRTKGIIPNFGGIEGFGGLRIFNAEAQSAQRVGRVEHVERVEGDGSDSGGSVAPRRSKEG